MKEKIKYWDKPFITAKTVVAVKNFVLCPWCENPEVKTHVCQMVGASTLYICLKPISPRPHFFKLFYTYHSQCNKDYVLEKHDFTFTVRRRKFNFIS